jgi:hypothetical protein
MPQSKQLKISAKSESGENQHQPENSEKIIGYALKKYRRSVKEAESKAAAKKWRKKINVAAAIAKMKIINVRKYRRWRNPCGGGGEISPGSAASAFSGVAWQ